MSKRADAIEAARPTKLEEFKRQGYAHTHCKTEYSYLLDWGDYCSENDICYIGINEYRKDRAKIKIRLYPGFLKFSEAGARAIFMLARECDVTLTPVVIGEAAIVSHGGSPLQNVLMFADAVAALMRTKQVESEN